MIGENPVNGMGGISASILAHSRHPETKTQLVTFALRYPRFIHSELMTHRVFSRNASSSRAIPVHRMLKNIEEQPAMPIEWGRNQKGMQADEVLSADEEQISENLWIKCSYDTIDTVHQMVGELGVHKQVANRLLEPFQFIDVIVTSTEWENFFNLRLAPEAQPEIRELARVMDEAMRNSKPKILDYGMWHLPLIYEAGWSDTADSVDLFESAGKCARVSYKRHDDEGRNNIELGTRLFYNGHMSPFEHQATPIQPGWLAWTYKDGVTHKDKYKNLWCNNFRWWTQFRRLLDENKVEIP